LGVLALENVLCLNCETTNLILGKERCIFGEESFRRIRLGVVIQMTSIGIPMIWMGEEIGE